MTKEHKIKRAKELYGNLVYPKTHIELYVDGYLAGAEEVKADCDFALEGKDVEIKELKEVLKGLLEEEEKGLWFMADGSDKSRYYKLREKAEKILER